MAITIRSGSDVGPEQPKYVWDQRIPRRHLTLFDALPGIGKSRSFYSVAGMLIGGLCLPGESTPRPPGVVAIAPAEDSPRAVVDCVVAAGGCPDRLILLGHGSTRLLSAEGIQELHTLVAKRQVDLLILDPLQSWIDGGMLSEGGRMRPVLNRLVRLASQTGVAVLGVRHLLKQSSGMATVYQGGGAAILAGTARSILRLDPDPTNAKQLVLWQAKNNLGKSAAPLSLRIVGRAGQAEVEWLGPATLEPESLFGGSLRHLGKRLAAAIRFLVLELRDGPQFVRYIKMVAGQSGHAWGTILRAADALQIETYHHGRHGGWYWNLSLDQPLVRGILLDDLADHLFHERPAAPAELADELRRLRPDPDDEEAAGGCCG